MGDEVEGSRKEVSELLPVANPTFALELNRAEVSDRRMTPGLKVDQGYECACGCRESRRTGFAIGCAAARLGRPGDVRFA